MYPSAYRFETRISKEVKSLTDMGLVDEIIIAGIWAPGLRETEQQSDRIKVMRLKTVADKLNGSAVSKVIRVLFFNIKAFILFKQYKFSFINCHSLWILPLCVMLKKTTGAKLIYDAHELETEREGLNGMRQQLAKYLERVLISKVDKLIVVGDFIGNWYRQEYNLAEVYVIKNIPMRGQIVTSKSRILKEKLNIRPDEILFIYQGVLSEARGVDVLLKAFANADASKHIVFMGYGPSDAAIIHAAESHRNIHFHPAVPLEDLTKYTSSADLGVFFIDRETSLSYKYSMPNKFFEYVYSGLPVLMSDFPEMKQLADTYNCGWQVENNQASLEKFITELTMDVIRMKQPDVRLFSGNHSWEKESKSFEKIYER